MLRTLTLQVAAVLAAAADYPALSTCEGFDDPFLCLPATGTGAQLDLLANPEGGGVHTRTSLAMSPERGLAISTSAAVKVRLPCDHHYIGIRTSC